MSATLQAAQDAQGDAEGPEASDEPPHEPSKPFGGEHIIQSLAGGDSSPHSIVHGHRRSIPLPPKDAGALPKEPGHTRGTLGQLIITSTNSTSTRPRDAIAQDLSSSSSFDSHSDSDSDSFPASTPSTVPHSRAASRAPSISQDQAAALRPRNLSFSSQKSQKDVKKELESKTPVASPAVKSQPATPAVSTPSTVRPAAPTKAPSRPPSVHSDGGGHKFNLKDLLASAPKLNRRSSQKSNASSDGDRRSTGGDSVTSLSKKYGVCERLAIGKGATSVVRLAHKWDRSEEKLYAVKVRCRITSEFEHGC